MATASTKAAPSKPGKPEDQKPSTEVATKTEAGLPDAWQGIDMYADAGMGLEHVEAKYLIIPHLRLLQSGSPQAKRSDPAYVDGAREGLFINTATGELFEKVLFVPCRFVPDHSEWEPGLQGDFIRSHGADSTEFDKCEFTLDNGRSFFKHPNGNEFAQRALFYGMIVKMDEENDTIDFDKAVASLGGTSFAVARRWLTQISSYRLTHPTTGQKFVAPMWARSFMLEASPQSNDDNSWMAWKFGAYANSLDLPQGRDLYLAAKEFAHQVDSGEAKAAEETEKVKPAAAAAPASGKSGPVDDKIPF